MSAWQVRANPRYLETKKSGSSLLREFNWAKRGKARRLDDVTPSEGVGEHRTSEAPVSLSNNNRTFFTHNNSHSTPSINHIITYYHAE